jgi:hypothetical protein
VFPHPNIKRCHDEGIKQQVDGRVRHCSLTKHPDIDLTQNYTQLTMDNDGQFWMGASSPDQMIKHYSCSH